VRYPGTALHKLPNARFYLTAGAAKLLVERQYAQLTRLESVSGEVAERLVVDLALSARKRVGELSAGDFSADRFGRALLERCGSPAAELATGVERDLLARLEAGSSSLANTTFLHTAPHHDDIMLGYLPFAVRAVRDASNRHTFAYMTSGFNAVTNSYALSLLEKLQQFLKRRAFDALLREGYFDPKNRTGRNRDVWQYLDGVAADRPILKDEAEARRLLRLLMEIFEEEDLDNLVHRLDELVSYFRTQYPGRRDLPYIQQLKGMIREWEADCLWGYFGLDSCSVRHLRLGFYKGEIFTEEPTVERDVAPVLRLLREVQPDVVTVALDPEASGPDTRYAEHARHLAELVPQRLRLPEGGFIPQPRVRRPLLQPGAADPGRAVPDAEDLPGSAVLQRASQPADPRDAGSRVPPEDVPGGVLLPCPGVAEKCGSHVEGVGGDNVGMAPRAGRLTPDAVRP